MIVSVLGMPGESSAAVPEGNNTFYNFQVSGCLDVSGGPAVVGARLITFQCHGGQNQRFSYRRQSDGWYTLSPLNGLDKCIASASDGVSVVLAQCSTSATQRWLQSQMTYTRVIVLSKQTGKFIYSAGAGAPVRLSSTNPATTGNLAGQWANN